MELSVENLESGHRCVKLAGRLDLKGTQEVDAQFTEETGAKKEAVLVDLSNVTYIASIGIRMFLSNIKQLRAANVKMVILKPQKMVEEVLKLAGVDAIIPIEHDQAAAVEILQGGNAA
jgi:anti-anti-sigma factor